MENLVRKGMRARPPQPVKIQLPGDVYDWFEETCEKLHCGEAVLMRGILVDFYEKHSAPCEEVPGNE